MLHLHFHAMKHVLSNASYKMSAGIGKMVLAISKFLRAKLALNLITQGGGAG